MEITMLKLNSYWDDDTSFVLDIGDGELTDKDGNDYFIHCEYNCNNGMWHYVFEIWVGANACNIYDIAKNERDEYLTETVIPVNDDFKGVLIWLN